MGVPTVTIVTDQFVTLARGTQKSQGLTDMCFVTVPHPIGMLPKEQVDAKVDAAFGDIVKAATQWQPVKEKEAAQESPYPAKTFKFTGTYADVNKLFAKRKWSLSLPIIPPTVDRVREMLKGTKRAPSEVLWVVPPRQGMLTVELVAVLGVMAGAQPEHMPLLLATIDAMKAPEAAWRGTSTTTAPTSPLIVISGPIVEKLKLNPGTGTAGGENPVTNALGYFVNLGGGGGRRAAPRGDGIGHGFHRGDEQRHVFGLGSGHDAEGGDKLDGQHALTGRHDPKDFGGIALGALEHGRHLVHGGRDDGQAEGPLALLEHVVHIGVGAGELEPLGGIGLDLGVLLFLGRGPGGGRLHDVVKRRVDLGVDFFLGDHAQRMGDRHKAHVGEALALLGAARKGQEGVGNDGDSGNAGLFKIGLVNYQP